MLDLGNNDISDLTPLAELTDLRVLNLVDNDITDLLPLVENTGFVSEDEILVTGNPLGYQSIHTHLPALQRRGVTLEFDDFFPDSDLRAAVEKTLGKAAGEIITVVDMKTLTRLDAPAAGIWDLTGLEYATNLTVLSLGEESSENSTSIANRITNISPLVRLTNLTELDLDHNPIADLSLLAGLTNLTMLSLRNTDISDITPLAGLTNLIDLNLGDNAIEDISPLAGLTNLTELSLWGNAISDIRPLVGLTDLTELDLDHNPIADLSLLAGLTNLTVLSLRNTDISDITPLAGLTKLEYLSLSGNAIEDISPLAGLTNLTKLWLSGDNISDITPLAGLTNLTGLGLWNNAISDLSVVARLTNLTQLFLEGNAMTDISLLAGLTNLTVLSLERNNISDITPLAGLTNLERVYLEGNAIEDISPLVENTGLGEGDYVNFTGWNGTNPLNDLSVNTHIPVLESRGVRVYFYNPKPVAGLPEDVNGDGGVDIMDLVLVSENYGQTGENDADVNADGVVNIDDIVLVAAVVDSAPTAPAIRSQIKKDLTAEKVRWWLTEAKLTGNKTPTYQRGILTLEQLLAALTPQETALLPNYPNPFNPETWIPYHLAHDADVTLTIYDIKGVIVRQLDLGYQPAGYYTAQSKAIYWDGRNESGELVASGVYFYQLRVSSSQSIGIGDYSKTRRMVILK